MKDITKLIETKYQFLPVESQLDIEGSLMTFGEKIVRIKDVKLDLTEEPLNLTLKLKIAPS